MFKKRTNLPLLYLYMLKNILCCGAWNDTTFAYHSYKSIAEKLHALHESYPSISHVYSIGKSVRNRDLWVIAVGRSPDSHVLLRPNVKLVASIHGNEASTKEVLLHYAEHLLVNYGGDDDITLLLNQTLIHILPLLNPDGLQEAEVGHCEGIGRLNANDEDLNRNFPDIFHSNYRPPRQQETSAIMKWLHDYRFVLSASLHNGALLVNVPYDNYQGSLDEYSMYAPSPDNDVFLELAYAYSLKHSKMHLQEELCNQSFHNDSLINGTVNGADWYASNGTMQDYNYIYGSCMEITLEIGCCKYPVADELGSLWLENKEALLHFTKKVHMGVRGRILNYDGQAITDVSVMIDRRMPVDVSQHGEFWKLLLPGNYTLLVIRGNEVVWEQYFTVQRQIVTELDVIVLANFLKRPANFSSLPANYFERKYASVESGRVSAAAQISASDCSLKYSGCYRISYILAVAALSICL